jgi:ABC-type Fe3+/spermidine/putrescine transport system ATPase subunit
MYQGRVVQVGTPVDLYEAPATIGVADFLGRANFVDAVVVGTQEDRVRVRIVSGQTLEVARGDSTWHPAPDEPATLFLRPERVRLGEDRSRGDVELPCTVHRCTFLGGIVRYALDAGGSRPMLADAQRLIPGLTVGKPAQAGFDLANLLAYPGTQRPWGEAA